MDFFFVVVGFEFYLKFITTVLLYLLPDYLEVKKSTLIKQTRTFVEIIVYRLGGLWSKSCLKFKTFFGYYEIKN